MRTYFPLRLIRQSGLSTWKVGGGIGVETTMFSDFSPFKNGLRDPESRMNETEEKMSRPYILFENSNDSETLYTRTGESLLVPLYS